MGVGEGGSKIGQKKCHVLFEWPLITMKRYKGEAKNNKYELFQTKSIKKCSLSHIFKILFKLKISLKSSL